MTNRRNFLKNTALVTAGVAFQTIQNTSDDFDLSSKKIRKPIVLSTWNFGLQANEAAWEILKNKGRALDAVEAGVKIPEGDPKERSVGYGGRPDREGRVTLDACIMDEFSNIGSVACLEHIKHPISVARAVMEKTPHVMLVGEGALQFALEQGFPKENLLSVELWLVWKSQRLAAF
jgi:N4-(beta-N-acetylglucosaminyl)-L-asparaginase